MKLSYRKSSQPIGHGRFGTVYSGQILEIFDKLNGGVVTKNFASKQVAVKSLTLKPKVHKELMILEKLNHPNIVRLLMFHKTDKEMYFLFEKMSQTLYDKLDQDGPMNEEDALWLALQLFRALGQSSSFKTSIHILDLECHLISLEFLCTSVCCDHF